jgi:hypothetical protein
LKKPDRKWIAVLALLAGMAWGVSATPHHGPLGSGKNLISGG